MDAVNLMERFEKIKGNLKTLENEVNRDEAVLEVKRDEFSEKRAELEEQGITFKSMKELKEYQEKLTNKITQQVEKMEQDLGIGEIELEDDEDYFDDFEDEI